MHRHFPRIAPGAAAHLSPSKYSLLITPGAAAYLSFSLASLDAKRSLLITPGAAAQGHVPGARHPRQGPQEGRDGLVAPLLVTE